MQVLILMSSVVIGLYFLFSAILTAAKETQQLKDDVEHLKLELAQDKAHLHEWEKLMICSIRSGLNLLPAAES